MGKPVISTTQSILGFLQWEEFEFQPYAAGTPTSWTSSPLPTGVTINGTTGLISGAAEKPGVYIVAIQAHNADGASAPVLFTIGIEASIADPSANVLDLICDLGTREVKKGPNAADAEDEGEALVPSFVTGDEAKKLAALGAPRFQAKRGDQLLFRVQFQRGGVAASVTLSELELAVKELEPESVLVTSSDFHSLGEGVFLVYIALESDELTGALSSYEGDYGTAFPGVCELTWLAANPFTANIGPADIRGSSKTFRGDLVRDITT